MKKLKPVEEVVDQHGYTAEEKISVGVAIIHDRHTQYTLMRELIEEEKKKYANGEDEFAHGAYLALDDILTLIDELYSISKEV